MERDKELYERLIRIVDARIDRQVYDFYGLTEVEMEIVDEKKKSDCHIHINYIQACVFPFYSNRPIKEQVYISKTFPCMAPLVISPPSSLSHASRKSVYISADNSL